MKRKELAPKKAHPSPGRDNEVELENDDVSIGTANRWALPLIITVSLVLHLGFAGWLVTA